jgi:Phasin protein
MSSTGQKKPGAKPARNRKAERNRKSAQPQKPDHSAGAEEQTAATLAPAAPTEAALVEAVVPADEPPVETVAAADVAPIKPAAPAETARVNLRTIANAYGDYTLKSFDEAKSFVEKLTYVRSLDKAVEVQTEFARQAYATFVADSQKIGELHKELTRQMFKPLESLVTGTIRHPR